RAAVGRVDRIEARLASAAMAHFAVTAIGSDRPGIVAAVTGALVQIGANLEDTEMAVLGGQFAMMLVVDAPPDVDIGAALQPAAERLELLVSVRPIAPDHGRRTSAGEEWSVTVYG